jgi:hypothetical protein
MSTIVLDVELDPSTDVVPVGQSVSPRADSREDWPTNLGSTSGATDGVVAREHRFCVLLDDPDLARWAAEAAWKYEVSPLQALELLADALGTSGGANGLTT